MKYKNKMIISSCGSFFFIDHKMNVQED